NVGSEGTGKFTGKFSETRHFGLVLVLPTVGNSAGFRENSLLVRNRGIFLHFLLGAGNLQGICREFENMRNPQTRSVAGAIRRWSAVPRFVSGALISKLGRGRVTVSRSTFASPPNLGIARRCRPDRRVCRWERRAARGGSLRASPLAWADGHGRLES